MTGLPESPTLTPSTGCPGVFMRIQDRDDAPLPHPARSSGATGVIAANTQWHDAELALKVARHSFERWRVAGHRDTPSPATMHAYHTHVALHEAARVIALLIETFRTEAAALITTPARDNGGGTRADHGAADRAVVGRRRVVLLPHGAG